MAAGKPARAAYRAGRRAVPPRRPTRRGKPQDGACPVPSAPPRQGAAEPGEANRPFSMSGGAQTHAPPETATALSEGELKVGVSRPISRVLSGGHLRDGHSSGAPLARRLEQPTRAAAGIEPGTLGASPERPRRPYSVLLPVGFAVPPPLPEARCALTAPFHPCRCGLPHAGGLISVALSLGSPPAAVSRHRQSLEPGLSSTARLWPQSRFARQRPSGRLTTGNKG